MVSEKLCLEILRLARGRTVSCTTTDADGTKHTTPKDNDAVTGHELYRHFLGRYELEQIDSAMRWLFLGDYIVEHAMGITGPKWHSLSDKGRAAADENRLPDEDRQLLYQEHDPYGVFIAHQFNSDDTDLVSYIRTKVLEPQGFVVLDGRADGLEAFRTAILTKIKRARFFLCLLTKRVELSSGGFASSVWLYQETGVAVAYGKTPLLLVEDGIASGFVGELQSIYEHIPFTRSNHPERFDAICRRFMADLEAHGIPAPKSA